MMKNVQFLDLKKKKKKMPHLTKDPVLDLYVRGGADPVGAGAGGPGAGRAAGLLVACRGEAPGREGITLLLLGELASPSPRR